MPAKNLLKGSSKINATLSAYDLLRKLFEDQSGGWKMIATDGRAFRFHKSILNEQVRHFRALFSNANTEEYRAKQIVVTPEVNMCGNSVEAFLRYVYYRDTAAMKKSFGVTCALVRAGYYYGVLDLVEEANEIILKAGNTKKPKYWFDIYELWELYEHVWLWEEHPTKSKLMESMQLYLKMYWKKKYDIMLSITNGNEVLRELSKGMSELSLSPIPSP